MSRRQEKYCLGCDDFHDPEESCDKHTAEKRAADSPPSLMSITKTALDIYTTVYDDLIEHVPGLITEGFGLIAGKPKIGKSWLTLDIALACSEGGFVLGSIPVEQRPVFLLALEDGPRRLKARMTQLGRTPTENLHIATQVQPLVIPGVIVEFLTEHPNGLVILDTFAVARREPARGENPYLADYKAGRDFKAITDAFPGSSLLAVHHTRKQGADDWMDTISGSQGVNGSADFTLALTRDRQSPSGTLSVTGRDIAEGEYAVSVTDCRWSLEGEDLAAAANAARQRAADAHEKKTSRLADRSLSALAYVQSRKETTPKDLAAYLDVSPVIAGNTLGRLADKGLILKSGRGAYVPINTTDESDESDENTGQGQKADKSLSDESGETDEIKNQPSPAISSHSSVSSRPTPADMPAGGRPPVLITSRRRQRRRQQTSERAS